MPRTNIAISTIPAGAAPHVAITEADADSSNGNEFVNSGVERLLVRNASGSSVNITIASVADPATGRTGDITNQAVANGVTRAFGPFPVQLWNQSTGVVNVTASAGTNVKLAVIKNAS